MSVEEIRKYRDLLESVLMEAQNYEEMFSAIMGIFKEYPDFSKDAEAEVTRIIQKSKAVLKTKDKIVWFLRQARLSLLNFFIINAYNDGINIKQAISNNKAKCQSLLNRYINEIRQSGNEQFSVRNIFNYGTVNNLLTDLEHYLSLPIPEIQNYNYNYQSYSSVVAHFKRLEDEWKKTVKDLIPFDPNDGEAILSFNDGFAWYNLNREYCNKEGSAMGHCGNTAAYKKGDRVLSLRKKVKVGNKVFVRPSLTFILHADGYLGEMKGRANTKPKPEYHDKIIRLLKSDIVKGIRGGGHAWQQNFKLQDLDNDTLKHLLEEKPALANADDLKWLLSNGVKPNDSLQLAAVKNDGYVIGDIIKAGIIPSEQVQLAAVSYDGYLIRYIIDAGITPSEAIQIAAAQKSTDAFAAILEAGIKPSEAVQIAAIKRRHGVINDFERLGIKPSPKVIAAAARQADEEERRIDNWLHRKRQDNE